MYKDYRSNPRCRCGRCRMAGMMGPAVLITLGVLFLIDQLGPGWNYSFGRTWPILLIVIGVVKVLQYSAPTEGHAPVGYVPPPPVVTPPPVPPAGSLTGPENTELARREDRNV